MLRRLKYGTGASITLVVMLTVSVFVAGCGHLQAGNRTPTNKEVKDYLNMSYVQRCMTHVCIEPHGEGSVYLVNGEESPMTTVWVVDSKGPSIVVIANPAMPQQVWWSIQPLRPGAWRLTVAITATAPLQSYAQLERYNPFKGWVWEHTIVFLNPGRIMLPNQAPPGAATYYSYYSD